MSEAVTLTFLWFALSTLSMISILLAPGITDSYRNKRNQPQDTDVENL